MAIVVKCRCGQEFQTRDENAGRRAQCPDCGWEMVIPDPKARAVDDLFVIGPAEPVAATSGKAIASLVLGLCFFCLAFAGIPAVILGAVALREIDRSRVRLKGRGLAIAGIVLGVFSTLLTVALLIPAVSSAREAARRAQCVGNLKQIALAMHNYHSVHDSFPPAAITDKQGRPLLNWRVAILPWIERSDLYNKFHLDEPWDSPHNLTLLNVMPVNFACPSVANHQAGMTNYQVIVDPRSMFRPDFKPVKIMDVTDGTSNTLMVGETVRAVPWTAPQDVALDMSLPQSGLDSYHPGGFNASFADGSVRFLKPTINPIVFRALITRDGGEVIDASSY